MNQLAIEVPFGEIAELCRRHHIRQLSLFGSVLRDDYGPDSDIDVLVQFAGPAKIGLLGLAGLELELSRLFARRVDLHTAGSLSPKFRDEVLAEAETVYVAP